MEHEWQSIQQLLWYFSQHYHPWSHAASLARRLTSPNDCSEVSIWCRKFWQPSGTIWPKFVVFGSSWAKGTAVLPPGQSAHSPKLKNEMRYEKKAQMPKMIIKVFLKSSNALVSTLNTLGSTSQRAWPGHCLQKGLFLLWGQHWVFVAAQRNTFHNECTWEIICDN